MAAAAAAALDHAQLVSELERFFRLRTLPGKAGQPLPWRPIYDALIVQRLPGRAAACSGRRFVELWTQPQAPAMLGEKDRVPRAPVDAAVFRLLRGGSLHRLADLRARRRRLCSMKRLLGCSDEGLAWLLGCSCASLKKLLDFRHCIIGPALQACRDADCWLARVSLDGLRRAMDAGRPELGFAAARPPPPAPAQPAADWTSWARAVQSARHQVYLRAVTARDGPLEALPRALPQWQLLDAVPLLLLGSRRWTLLCPGAPLGAAGTTPLGSQRRWHRLLGRLDDAERVRRLCAASERDVGALPGGVRIGADGGTSGLYAVAVHLRRWETRTGAAMAPRTLLYVGKAGPRGGAAAGSVRDRVREHITKPAPGSMLDLLLRCRLRRDGRPLVDAACVWLLQGGLVDAGERQRAEHRAIHEWRGLGVRGCNLEP